MTPKFAVGQKVRLTPESAAWIRTHDGMPITLPVEALTAMIGEVKYVPTQYADHYVVRFPILFAEEWAVMPDGLSEVISDG